MNLRYLPFVLCLVSAGTVAAQPNDATKPATKPVATSTTNKSAKDPEAERIAKERRDNAQALLISLAADAGRFNDQTLRARTQARIADVLWSADPDRARAMFRKAWESAEIVDQEAQRKLQEEIAQQKAKNGGPVAVTGPRDIRSEVLRLAARHDRALGEEFLSKLKIEKQQEATDAADKALSNPFDAPEAARQRLNLARQLLDADVVRALQFADPVLGNITRDAVDFLSYLREKDAAAADQRYAALLAMATNNLQSDANIVSLLGSYIFTPHTFVTFDGNGSSVSSTARSTPPDIPPGLRNAFFNTAAEILLRPMAPPGQDQSTTGIQGKYLMLKRLLPLFEQYAPKELTDSVRTQMEAMSNLVSEDTRKADDNTLREGILPAMSAADREKTLLDRVDRAKTSEQRDQLYLQLARLFIDNDDNKAHDYVDKIEDTDLRKQARPFIDASMMMRAVDKKNVDRLLELVRAGELTHFQKAWALSRAASFLAKTDREKSLSLIDDAITEARGIDQSDPDRPRAMLAVTNVILLIDRAKAWDLAADITKAANSAEGFTGEDGAMRVSLITKGSSSIRSSSSGEFDVSGVVSELAKDDYNRAIDLVRGFEKEAPRASATIAIAKAVLEEKKN
jgi:hypothetical protein